MASPFAQFIAGSIPTPANNSAPGEPDTTTAPGEPTATIAPVAGTGETPLADGLRKTLAPDSLGPPSSTRPITRSNSNRSIPPATQNTDTSPARKSSEENNEVSAFEYFGLISPPSGNESGPKMSGRNSQNMVSVADILYTFDGRLERLERGAKNATLPAHHSLGHEPEDRVSLGTGNTREADSKSEGSVDTTDELDELSDRVDDVCADVNRVLGVTEDHSGHLVSLDDRI